MPTGDGDADVTLRSLQGPPATPATEVVMSVARLAVILATTMAFTADVVDGDCPDSGLDRVQLVRRRLVEAWRRYE